MSVKTIEAEPVLDDATRDFVRRSMHAQLVELADIKKVVVSLMAEDTRFSPERLADGLVGANLLTPWQARKLLAGKARGFFLGNYKLMRPLGKGGMGVVFLAKHSVMNRLMALKILPAEASKDARRIERFKEEARASAKLEHPNIVQAFDFSEADGKLYIVMEYVDGVDLHRAVVRDGVMSPTESLDAMIQSADALAHAHQRGIVHRDIKPSNMLLRSDGVIKVSDMGLARIGYNAGDSESPNRLTGTADFIAPEQAIDSQTVDARADIYSLGCTWYFLLCGRAPFSGSNVAQRLAKHQTAPVPAVSAIRGECPKAISELIQKMMAKRAEDRPASAAELLVQLKRLRNSVAQGGDLSDRPMSSRVASGESSTPSSIDDSGPLKEVGASSISEPIELDLGSLPSIEVTPFQPAPMSANGSAPSFAGSNRANSKAKDASSGGSGSGGDSQNVLLGIGLAISTMALLVVIGITIFQLTKEEKKDRPLHSMESGKEIIVLQD
ncbi:serine/threonine protein kinase [Roseiconus lacunae]|uniref:serine/threonine protein kinase n=1 Tax=Roseiconus lacunae TaxID=2605694 RepID=UPI001E3E6A6E|nr:serine/threonine-protein kinase [Roseiconus lacunae]MCD0458498.1 serine/threonine protein kinase [Roseiconus lacunae]